MAQGDSKMEENKEKYAFCFQHHECGNHPFVPMPGLCYECAHNERVATSERPTGYTSDPKKLARIADSVATYCIRTAREYRG